MSARASYYAKNLAVCPNGESITPREKLVLIVLADNHQDKSKHFTYPSIETIAEDALCDRRSCQRYLASLERKGVIVRLRPPHQGRGMQVFYFFRELDQIPEGWHDAALSLRENSQPKGGKRATEGRQKGGKSSTPSITNINPNEELKPDPPTPAVAGEDVSTRNTAGDLDSEQLAHLEQLRQRGEDAKGVQRWEDYYRESNAAKAREAAERDRAEAAARAAFPDRKRAVVAIMRGCRFVEGKRPERNPIPAVLDQVLEQEEREGREAWVAGPRMIGAWHRSRKAEGVRYGPLKFYRDGHWLEFVAAD